MRTFVGFITVLALYVLSVFMVWCIANLGIVLFTLFMITGILVVSTKIGEWIQPFFKDTTNMTDDELKASRLHEKEQRAMFDDWWYNIKDKLRKNWNQYFKGENDKDKKDEDDDTIYL